MKNVGQTEEEDFSRYGEAESNIPRKSTSVWNPYKGFPYLSEENTHTHIDILFKIIEKHSKDLQALVYDGK